MEKKFTTKEVVVVAMVAAVIGVIYTLLDWAYMPLSAVLGTVFMELTFGVYMLSAAMPMYLVRKPGFAIFGALVTAGVNLLLGSPYGLQLELAVQEDATRVAVCQILQNQLSEVGIDLSLNICDGSTYTFRANEGEFQMMFFFWICAAGHGDYQQYSLLHSSQQGAAGNRSFYSNPEADEYIMNARQTMDEEVARENYRKLEAIVDEEVPCVELLYTTLNVGATKNVVDFQMDRAGYHNLETVVVYE